jgi:streptogramin lyase
MHLLRLDGKTGEILDAIDEPQYPSMLVPTYGPYGGAIDPENAMWVLGLGGPLARVDPTTLEIDRWDVPSGTQPYGIAIDGNGDPWLASLTGEVIHFDRAASSFDVIEATTAGLRGLQVDRNGVVWAAHGVPGGNLGCGLVAVDVATRTLIDGAIDLPGCVEPVGVSVDVDGYVWLPDKGKDGAFKVDPTTYATDFVGGLVSPYTYSDMTGSGLALVAFPPAG